MTSFNFPAIGTEWQIDLSDKLTEKKAEQVRFEIFCKIEEFDKKFSRFRKDSWITQHRNFKGEVSNNHELNTLLNLYRRLNFLTDGKFTPLIGTTLEQAGYDSDYSLKPKKLTPLKPFLECLEWDHKTIKFKENVLLDFGAAGKGFLVDLIATLLEKNKILNFCIDAGGDILYKTNSREKIRVGLEHPDDPTSVIGVAEISNKSICASAGNRRKWDKFHHTIDPTTLTSPDEIKGVWVIASDAITADAIATCLFLDPDVEKYKEFNFECVLMYKDNTVSKTKGFEGELFTK